jgi:predicted porin
MSIKKSAVALAMMSALGAQAQVTLFGTLDMSLASIKPLASTDRVTNVASSGLTDSYLGIAVQEDLGGGLKASAQLETLISADTGAASPTFWGRNANVSIASDFGTLTVGRKQTVFFDSVAAYNPFGEASLGVSRDLITGLTQTGAASDVAETAFNTLSAGDKVLFANAVFSESRSWANSITYATPDISGLSASIQLGMKEGSDAGNNLGATVNYAAGPFAAGFAYQVTKLGAVDLVGLEDTRWVLGASYDLGMAKLYGQLAQSEWKSTVSGATALETSAFQLGASVPLSEQGTVMVSLGQAKDDTNGAATDKVTAFSLGYDHTLSKRTDVYGVVKLLKETAVENGNALAVGVRHRF